MFIQKPKLLCVEWEGANTGWHISVHYLKNLHTHEVKHNENMGMGPFVVFTEHFLVFQSPLKWETVSISHAEIYVQCNNLSKTCMDSNNKMQSQEGGDSICLWDSFEILFGEWHDIYVYYVCIYCTSCTKICTSGALALALPSVIDSRLARIV